MGSKRSRGRRRREWRKYRSFVRKGLGPVLTLMREVVESNPPPFRVKVEGTPGRPPTPARVVVLFLLVKAMTGCSFDAVHNLLFTFRDIARMLGIENVPGASTVQGLVERIPVAYMDGLIRDLSRRVSRKKWNTAVDSSGMITKDSHWWYDMRYGKKRRKKEFLKLHLMIVTLARYPIILSASVTEGTRGDSPELRRLLKKRDKSVPLGNLDGDPAYASRGNADLIEADGGRPVIKIKKGSTAKAKGSPAWKRMVAAQTDPELKQKFDYRYQRRAVIEGVFGAFKGRFGEVVRAHRRHNQRIELLCRVVVWDLLAVAYHTRF